MANQLLSDTLHTTACVFDTAFELGAEQDILLADYDKAVFKIVKTKIDYTITQKYINGSKLVVEGFFTTRVFYQPPQSEKLTTVTKKQPFEKQLELGNVPAQPCFICVEADLQYANTRAVNPTRITVNGLYSFLVRVYCCGGQQVATAINSTTTCTDTADTTGFTLQAATTKQFSMEDEIAFPDDMEKILNITTKPVNVTTHVYRDKVNVKGEIAARITYTTTDSPQLFHMVKNFSFNQIADLTGTTENSVAFSHLTVQNFTITANQQTEKSNCIVTAVLDIQSFTKENIILVADAFSKNYEYTQIKKTIAIDENILSINKTHRLEVQDTVSGGCTVDYHFVDISPVVFSSQAGLTAKVTLSAIVKNNQGEYECITKNETITFETDTPLTQEDAVFLWRSTNNSSVTITDDLLKAQITIDIQGFVIKKKQTQVLAEFEEFDDKPIKQHTDALVLYYAEKGEKIFDIAYKYKTDADLIMKENGLEDKYITQDQTLVISAFGL